MALLFMDGCDIYGTSSALLAQRYTRLAGTVDANFSPQSTGGRFNGGHILLAANPDRQLIKMFNSPRGGESAPADNELHAGFYFRFSALPSATRAIFYLMGTSGGRPLVVCLTASGTLELRATNTTGTQFGSTGTTVLAVNTWYWIQTMFRARTASGRADLRINNNSEISFTGNTRIVSTDDVWGFALVGGQTSPAINHLFDDVMVWDNTGSWPNTWLSAQRIATLVPDAAGSYNETYFMNSASSIAATSTLGEADQNTTFLDIAGEGRVSLNTASLPVSPPNDIHAVNIGVFAGNLGSVPKNAHLICRTQTAEAESSARVLQFAPATLGIFDSHFLVDPSTSAAWTEANINSFLQAGVRIDRPNTLDPEGTQLFGFLSGDLPTLSSVSANFANEVDISVFDYSFGREREVDRVFFTPTQTNAGFSARAVIYDISPTTGFPVNLLGLSNQTTGATNGTQMAFVFPHTVPVFPGRKYGIGLWANAAINANTVGQNSLFYATFAYASSGYPSSAQPPDTRYSPGALVPVTAQALIPASRAPGTYRFWRVRVPSTAVPATYVELRELEFRTSVGGANAATGGQAISSGNYSLSYPPWRGFDNNTTTTWASAIYTSGDQWLGYLFPASVSLAQILWRNYSSTTAAPSQFFVDRSDDGVTWTQTNAFSGLTWTSDEVKTFNL